MENIAPFKQTCAQVHTLYLIIDSLNIMMISFVSRYNVNFDILIMFSFTQLKVDAY